MSVDPALGPDTLPTPVERPAADLIIYDGQCGFCQQQMRRLHRWDKQNKLAYLSLHDEQVSRRWPDLSQQQLMRQMCLITQDNQRYHGAEAFKYLSTTLPRLWPLAIIMHIPLSMPIWRWVYRVFAKQRYWLSKRNACADEACQVHVR